MSTRKTYESVLKSIQKDFEIRIQGLADDIRAKEVVPACELYHLGYVAGNGIFYFLTEDGEYLAEEEDAEEHGILELISVIKILNLEVSYNQSISDYVLPVKGKILKCDGCGAEGKDPCDPKCPDVLKVRKKK